MRSFPSNGFDILKKTPCVSSVAAADQTDATLLVEGTGFFKTRWAGGKSYHPRRWRWLRQHFKRRKRTT